MEAQCKCGISVVITDVRQNGHSFILKPGESLDELCPIIIERREAKNDTAEPEECPNLSKAVSDRIEKFRREHS
jgi:hypothetical protein